ncbi:hypothetical protein Tco_0973240 [Tanacetum coccineum]
MIKEHDQQAKEKATPRRLAYADSDKEAPVSQSQRTPSKNKEPAHLRRSRRLEDRSTTKEKARRERSKPRGKRSGHQETSSDSKHEEGSEDTYEDLNSPYKRPMPTPFTQRITHFKYHRRVKLPRNIRNEGLQAFMDRFKSESSHIKGVPPVLRISAFMHGHGHPELAKKLNDKIPKTVDEMFERVKAFIRGEVTARSAEMTPKEILAMESVSFPEPPPLIGTPEKQNLNKFCDYHGDRGHNTNDCYQLKKQIEEVMASGNLAHLVKDIFQNNQKNESQGRNNVKVLNMIREGGNRKRPFEEKRSEGFLLIVGVCQRSCMNIASKASMLTSGQDSEDAELRWKGMKKQNGANGVRDNKMSFAIQRHNRKDRNETPRSGRFYHPFYDQIPHQPRNRNNGNQQRGSMGMQTLGKGARFVEGGPVPLEKTWGGENTEEVFTISHERPKWYVTMGTTLTADCKRLLTDVLRENMEPVVHKRRPMTPDGRLVLKEKVLQWLKEGMIRKVQHPVWVANTIPVKLANGT